MTRAFFAPGSLEEALALLAEHPGTRPIAGGTDLVVGARQGKAPLPEGLVAIHNVRELRRIEDQGDRVVIGALATHAMLESSPVVRTRLTALADGAALVGSPATRNAGTIGGNLANASPAMDTGAPLAVLGAVVELRITFGGRDVAVADLWTGPGRTTLEPNELITSVRVPYPGEEAGSAYVRLEYRRAMEIAVVGAAALVELQDGQVQEARLALTAVAPTIVRAYEAERALAGTDAGPEALAEAARLAAGAAQPITDVRGSEQYRRAQVEVIARRALDVAVRRARGEDVPVPANRSIGVNRP